MDKNLASMEKGFEKGTGAVLRNICLMLEAGRRGCLSTTKGEQVKQLTISKGDPGYGNPSN